MRCGAVRRTILPRMTADPLADDHSNPSIWTGWIAFGAAMIMLVGTFHVIQGLVALLADGYLHTTPDGLVVEIPYTVLGWLQIGLGVVSLAVGIGMLMGVLVALVAGVIVAAVSAIVHMAMIAANPLWSVIVIAFDILVIFAIATHGQEMRLLRQHRSSPYAGEEAWITRAR
jgi:hypothetical protein